MLKHIPFYASLLNRELGATKAQQAHVLVYGAIEAHSFGPKGCIASNQTLAEETGLSVGTVKNTISELKGAGWVFVTYDDNNLRSGINPMLEITPPSPPGDTPVTPRLHPRHPQVTIDNSREDSETLSSNELEESDLEDDVSFVEDEDLKPNRPLGKKRDTSYRKIYRLWQAGGQSYPSWWNVNPHIKGAAERLLKEKGEEKCRRAVNWWLDHKDEPFCPDLSTPKDLEEKWDKALNYKYRDR